MKKKPTLLNPQPSTLNLQPVRPKKRLGQNFLRDPNVVRKLVGALRAPEGAAVVEIGAGTGALTEALLPRFPDLVALEVDERAVAYLRRQHPSLDVRHADVLEVDWKALAGAAARPLYVIGNLPYYITSPILFALLDARAWLQEAVLTMQREVAERIVASPRTKAYGVPSVLAQLVAEPELLFRISRHVFYPKPDVTSAVLRLTFGGRAAPDVDSDGLRRVVQAAFNQRRKVLRNSLSAWTKEEGLNLPHGWDQMRAEELTPDDFLVLARHLQQGAGGTRHAP